MIKRLLPLIFICLVFPAKMMAQNGTLIYNMETLPQTNVLNPSFIPNANVYVTLTSFTFQANAPFSYASLWTNDPRTGNRIFDGPNFVKGLNPNNRLNLSPEIGALGFGFRASDKLFFNMSIAARTYFNMDFTNELFDFAVNGNGNYIGKKAHLIEKHFAEAAAWGEIAFGGAYEYDEKWTFGAKLKLLSGMVNFSSNNSSLSFETGADIDYIRANYNLDLRVSGLDFDSLNIDEASFEGYSPFDNFGLALDLGATYKLNEKFEFSASIIDLGFINWGANTKYIRSINGNPSSFEFTGFEWDEIFGENGFNGDVLEKLADTIKSKFEYETIDGGSYSQMIPFRFYLGGSYQIIPNLKASLLYRGEFVRSNYYSTTSMSIGYSPFRMLEITVGNSIVGTDWFCPGFGINVGPFYFVANYVSDFYLAEMKTFNIQTGFNIMIGNPNKKKQEQE